jgi:hypothetical protein
MSETRNVLRAVLISLERRYVISTNDVFRGAMSLAIGDVRAVIAAMPSEADSPIPEQAQAEAEAALAAYRADAMRGHMHPEAATLGHCLYCGHEYAAPEASS